MKKTIKITDNLTVTFSLLGLLGIFCYTENHTLYIGIGLWFINIGISISKPISNKAKGKIYNPFIVSVNGKHYKLRYYQDIDSLRYVYDRQSRRYPTFKYIGKDEGYLVFDPAITSWKHFTYDSIYLAPEGTEVKGMISGNSFIITDIVG